jgi:hypothetical protein
MPLTVAFSHVREDGERRKGGKEIPEHDGHYILRCKSLMSVNTFYLQDGF